MGKKTRLMILPICLLLAGWVVIRALAQEGAPRIIQINVNQLGPQRLGPLPAVVSPPGNPTSSLKIHLHTFIPKPRRIDRK